MLLFFPGIILLALFIAMVFPWLSNFVEVDKCLDSGGSYDYANCKCDHKESHKYQELHFCGLLFR